MASQLLPLRVMVVDDNRDAADMIAEFLHMCGHDALPVYGGAEAIKAADAFRPDVMLLDLGMPEITGFDVASTLRRARRFRHTRIIALTAWGDARTRERTQVIGFDHHLVKPASLDDILSVVSAR
ncbi:response regulator [Janthinobacterium sp. RB2R34]|uniref:response regulator n=1 Tax=Janthinobacterium sp. RB2R34 TaxID=3424193 RepID=UPI003F2554EE